MLTSEHGAQVDLARRVRVVGCCAIMHDILISKDGILDASELRNPIFDDDTDGPDIVSNQSPYMYPTSSGKVVQKVIMLAFCLSPE